jgi:hypothetical protein
MAATKIWGSRQIAAASLTNTEQAFGTPSSASDVATKGYVDSVAQGLSAKPSAVAGTTTALSPTNTYSSGVLTATGVGTLTVDGILTALNDYILVKNEASGLKNGLYKVTTAGTAGVPYVLTRAVEMDISAEFTGAFVFVEGGTVNEGSGWIQTSAAPTVGTTAIVFVQFSGAGSITAGNGLSKSGNTLSIDTAITADLTTVQTLANKNFSSPFSIDTFSVTLGGAVDFGSDVTLDGVFTTIGASDLVLRTAVGGTDVTFPSSGTLATLTDLKAQKSTAVSGTQDSSNKIFTIANTLISGSEQVFLNGQLLMPGASNDYVYNGTTTITFQAGFTAPSATDVIRVYGAY